MINILTHPFRDSRALILLLLGIIILNGCSSTDVVPTAPPPNRNATPVPAINTPNASVPAITPPSGTPPTAFDACPFTGLPLNGIDLAERRPLVIKIGNSPPERPQSGLAQADVVVEHLTEGAITRFSAVYYCSDAADIGPIRSARLIDLELVPMFNAIFAHVGGSEPVRQMIAASELAQSDLDDYGRAPIFREVAGRKRPFNRYTSTKELWDLARTKGWIPGSGVQSFNFSATTPVGGRAVTSLTIPYRANLSDVTYTYNASVGAYLRSFGTAPHFDAASGKQLLANNVVVLWATHTTTDIIEDSLNSHSIQITTTGSGKAQIFRDGQAFDARWTRSDTHAVFQFITASGQSLALKPGTTWFEVVPPEMQLK